MRQTGMYNFKKKDMSKVDLTSLEWCELIFKDRNKNYGAYKMRRDLGKRQTAALVIVTAVAFAGFTLPRLVRMAIPAQKEEMVEVTQLSALEEPEVKEEVLKRWSLSLHPLLPSRVPSSLRHRSSKR